MDRHWRRAGALTLALCLATLAALAAVAVATAEPMAGGGELLDLQGAWSAQTMDPHWMYDAASARVATQVYDRLVQRRGASEGELVPALATGWQASPAADIYTFTIR